MCANLCNSILLKELKIYQWIFSVFGLNYPPYLIYRQQKDIKYYFGLLIYLIYSLILLSTACWAAYKHNILVKRITFSHELDSMTQIITYLQNNSVAFLILLLEYKAWYCRKQLMDILQLIKKLEDLMFIMCPIMFRNHKLRLRLLGSIGLFLIILITFLLVLNFYLISNELNIICRLLAVFFLTSVETKFLEYGIYVQLIYEYLKMLLNSLNSLRIKVENEKQRQQPLAWYYTNTLRQNRECLIEIWFLIHKLERYFAGPIFLLVFHNGIVILCTVNWSYVQYIFETNPVYQIFRLVFITMILINILLLSYLTQKCINKYQQFSILLLNFKLYPHDRQMIMGLREYSLQLMHHHIKFTCNGYMDIDLSYFGKIFFVIVAYVIILLQFKLNNLSEGVIRATKTIFGNL